MIRTAVDSSSLLDLFSSDINAAGRSNFALREAAREGELIVCEVVLAELGPSLRGRPAREFSEDWNLEFVPATVEVAELAAKYFAAFTARGGKGGRVVMDFLIGAHATLLADRLLTTDKGFQRDYFDSLKLLTY